MRKKLRLVIKLMYNNLTIDNIFITILLLVWTLLYGFIIMMFGLLLSTDVTCFYFCIFLVYFWEQKLYKIQKLIIFLCWQETIVSSAPSVWMLASIAKWAGRQVKRTAQTTTIQAQAITKGFKSTRDDQSSGIDKHGSED